MPHTNTKPKTLEWGKRTKTEMVQMVQIHHFSTIFPPLLPTRPPNFAGLLTRKTDRRPPKLAMLVATDPNLPN